MKITDLKVGNIVKIYDRSCWDKDIDDTDLTLVGTLHRTVIQDAVDSYTINLHGNGNARVNKVPYPSGGTTFNFSVYELM